MARSPAAKSNLAGRLTSIWFRASIRYSIGSSTVMMLLLLLTSSMTEAYSVVVFPEPVGPDTNTMP